MEGKPIFLAMTEYPESEVTTVRALQREILRSSLMRSTSALGLTMRPSVMMPFARGTLA